MTSGHVDNGSGPSTTPVDGQEEKYETVCCDTIQSKTIINGKCIYFCPVSSQLLPISKSLSKGLHPTSMEIFSKSQSEEDIVCLMYCGA